VQSFGNESNSDEKAERNQKLVVVERHEGEVYPLLIR